MGRKSRAKARRQEHGWVVELSYRGYPAGRYWFNTKGKVRTPPPNAKRMVHHTLAGGRLQVASSRPVSRERS